MPIDFVSFLADAYVKYGCDTFGNDTVGHRIWESLDSTLDLVKGDGVDSDTFPTFVANAAHGTQYYSFDGVDDYLSNWPTLTGDYTVSAAFTSSYPDGVPYVTQSNDSTIEDLLTVSGAFAGNLHSLVIFDRLLEPLELYYLEWVQLRRLWRETHVDAFLHRIIREGVCVFSSDYRDPTAILTDYSDSDIDTTPLSVLWDEGVTFPDSDSAVELDADAAVNLDEITIFVEAEGFDTLTAGEYLLQNGTNYSLTVDSPGSDVEFTFNGSVMATPQGGYSTFAISAITGSKPRLYCDGYFKAEGDSVVTLTPGGAGQLYVGNNTARNSNYPAVLTKLSIFSERLTDAEVGALHLGARTSRTYPLNGDYIMGFDTAGPATLFSNTRMATYFSPASDGQVTEFSILADTTGNVKFAIYQGATLATAQLLYAQDVAQVAVGGQLNRYSIPMLPVTAGGDYWLAAISDTIATLTQNTGVAGTFYFETGVAFAPYTFPDPYGGPGSLRVRVGATAAYGVLL